MASVGEVRRTVAEVAEEEEQKARAALSAAVQATSLAWAQVRDKLDAYDVAQPATAEAFEEARGVLQTAERAGWEAAERLLELHKDRQNRRVAVVPQPTVSSVGEGTGTAEPT
jgi:hypothetical protein